MRSEIISQEKNITNIKVTVPVEDFHLKIDEAAEQLRRKANIKGFRKGHVPRKVLELHLGPDAIRAEALEKLVPEVMDKIIGDYELDLITDPKVEIVSFESEKPVEMTLIFETRPEVEIPDFGNINIPMKNVQVTEKMLDDAIMALRENNAGRNPVEDRESAEGDILEVEYTVNTDAREPNDPDKSSEIQKGTLEIGSPSARKELSIALSGRRSGDSVEVEVPVQSDDGSESKVLNYSIKINSISEKILPEMDPVFFQKITGEAELSENEFREKVMEKLQLNFKMESRKDAENKALNSIVEKSKVEIPESLVEKQKQAIIADMTAKIKKQTGKSIDDYFAENGLERETFDKGADSEARGMVKRSLVLEAISESEMIQVENSDIEKEIHEMSLSFGVPVDQMQQFFLKNSDGIADLVHRVRMRKTVDRIMEKIVLEEENPEGENQS